MRAMEFGEPLGGGEQHDLGRSCKEISEDYLPFRGPTHCSLLETSRLQKGPTIDADMDRGYRIWHLVGGQERDSMEARIGKADFLEVVIGSDQWRTAVKARNCVPHAVELGISLAKVESNIELTESCEAELRQVFKVTQTYWNRCGRMQGPSCFQSRRYLHIDFISLIIWCVDYG